MRAQTWGRADGHRSSGCASLRPRGAAASPPGDTRAAPPCQPRGPAAPAARTSQSALPPPRRDAEGGAARRRRREEAGGGGGAGERSSWLLPPPASRTASVSGAGTFPAPPAGAAQVTGRGRAVARPFPSLVLCPLCSRPFRQAPAPRWARLPPLAAVSSGAERRQRGLGAVVSLPSAGHSRRLFAGAFVVGEGSYAVGCDP